MASLFVGLGLISYAEDNYFEMRPCRVTFSQLYSIIWIYVFFSFIWFALGLLPVWGYFGPLCGHMLLSLLDKDLEVWFSYSNQCEVASRVSLLCFCLMTSDVEHLFTCLFTVHVSLVECSCSYPFLYSSRKYVESKYLYV